MLAPAEFVHQAGFFTLLLEALQGALEGLVLLELYARQGDSSLSLIRLRLGVSIRFSSFRSTTRRCSFRGCSECADRRVITLPVGWRGVSSSGELRGEKPLQKQEFVPSQCGGGS